MTSQSGESRTRSTLRDRVHAVLNGPGPVDEHALLAVLDAEADARELRAYKAGWNDALTELRGRRGHDHRNRAPRQD
ncbi:hypothetical protein ACFYNX_16375 [Streptomyces sp. NPDC007872]|uniref:hypothetical protein n=1 Tax=Streptomyces sp. NPDC007872 TaxID=3364782 RepID=UPI0036861984